jgi:UDP-N-acetylmuramate dehydrogenase
VPEVTRDALSRYTTLRLGGPAERLIVATGTDELLQTVRAQSHGRSASSRAGDNLLILAGGSNVVIADTGWPGTVVLLRTTGIDVTAVDADQVDLTAQAGQSWDDVVAFAVDAGLSGLECLSGIPGSAGATPIQNVGAYGQEVAATITAVRVYDRTTDEVRVMAPADCGFAYRSSVFKHRDRYLVLSVTFRLRRSADSAPIRYEELARTLGTAPGERVPLAVVRETVLGLRSAKGMVLDEGDADTRSAGSFFTNPLLPLDRYEGLRLRALETVGAEPPCWPEGDAHMKVSAAWLIERAGFHKGYSSAFEGVALSGKHTLSLTNRGTGTTEALLGLAREIRDGVVKAFEVTLEPEPVLVNCAL